MENLNQVTSDFTSGSDVRHRDRSHPIKDKHQQDEELEAHYLSFPDLHQPSQTQNLSPYPGFLLVSCNGCNDADDSHDPIIWIIMGLTQPRVRIIHHKNITRTADIDIQTFLDTFIKLYRQPEPSYTLPDDTTLLSSSLFLTVPQCSSLIISFIESSNSPRHCNHWRLILTRRAQKYDSFYNYYFTSTLVIKLISGFYL